MNVFFIRTKLQCLIAKALIDTSTVGRRYSVVFLYQHSSQEDSESVYEIYRELANGASKTGSIIIADGVWIAVLKSLFWVCYATVSGGRCYLASIDHLPLALALKLIPGSKLETFDDGSANILHRSKYFKDRLELSSPLKKRILRYFFPWGWAHWMRLKSRRHYTIFRNHSNVVDDYRLAYIRLDWSGMLSDSDAHLIPQNVQKVLLGTAYHELRDGEDVSALVLQLAPDFDLYIRHPRERAQPGFGLAVNFKSPAESILAFLSRMRPILVCHFNSTAAYSLSEYENIEFLDLYPLNQGRVDLIRSRLGDG